MPNERRISLELLVSPRRLDAVRRAKDALSRFYRDSWNVAVPDASVDFFAHDELPMRDQSLLAFLRELFFPPSSAYDEDFFSAAYRFDNGRARIRLDPFNEERFDPFEVAYGLGIVTLLANTGWRFNTTVSQGPDFDVHGLYLQMVGELFQHSSTTYLANLGFATRQDAETVRRELGRSPYLQKVSAIVQRRGVTPLELVTSPALVVMDHHEHFPAFDPVYVPRSPLQK